jgi:hypothetical protein
LSIYGLVLDAGTLYALSANTSDSELLRTLEPTTGTPSSGKWSTKTSTASFNRTPSALRVSAGSTILWAISSEGAVASTGIGLYSYTDTLGAGTAVALVSPAEGYQNPINTVSGGSQDIAFSWTKPTSGSIAYEVRIYSSDGSTSLTTATKAATDADTPNILIGPNQTGTQALTWAPGQTYYWAVRTSSPVYSPWSEKRSFTIEPLGAQTPSVLAPANGGTITNVNPAFSWSPTAGSTKYEFQLSLNTGFSPTLVAEQVSTTGIRPVVKLDPGLTYFWRVRALEPVRGDWSAIANFTVEEPVEAAPPIIVEQTPPPQITIPAPEPAPVIQIPEPAPPPAQIAPGYIWAIIIIGAVLVIPVIVLIVRTRRTV